MAKTPDNTTRPIGTASPKVGRQTPVSRKFDIGNQLSDAVKLHQAGEFFKAKSIYEHILEVHPWHADALHLLGLLAHQTGNHSTALALINKAISIHSQNPTFFNHRGLVLHALGDSLKALDSYEQALALNPRFADAHLNMGNAFATLRQDSQATASFDLAIQADPCMLQAYLNKATILEKIGQSQAAVYTCDEALELRPDLAQAHCIRGISLTTLGSFQEAIKAFDRALGLIPNFVPALCNRGIAFQRNYQYELALRDFNESILLEPRNSNLYFNRGALVFQMGDILGALDNYNNAIEIAPNNAEASHNKALLYLSQMEFDKGWDLLHWRFANPRQAQAQLQTSLPIWEPGMPDHRRVLIWAEQGVGDQVLFATLLKEAKKRIPDLHVMLDSRLIPLFQRSLIGICFHPQDKPINQSDFDAHTPIMRLGGIFRRNLHDFPSPRYTFMVADPTHCATLKSVLLPRASLICGIFWRSRHNKNERRKSLELKDLLPILRIPGIKFVNLQYGDTRDECRVFQEETGIEILSCDSVDNFNDLDGHAALIQTCDFVVGCSNTSAHFAGALGKKAYLALAHGHGTFWYWANEVGGHSLWYPSIKIHRQQQPGNWVEPIEAIRSDILASMHGIVAPVADAQF
jgi:tetratricopeptide (TPR) repeat protein